MQNRFRQACFTSYDVPVPIRPSLFAHCQKMLKGNLQFLCFVDVSISGRKYFLFEHILWVDSFTIVKSLQAMHSQRTVLKNGGLYTAVKSLG